MRPSLGKSSVTVLRSIAGLTQEQLAALVDCSRMSIQAIESAKLQLSRSMAEKISLNTGVCMQWLLANKYRVPPVCAKDPERPYTREAFKMTRAEISNPRVNPQDVEVIHSMLAAAFAQLCNAAIQAYRTDKITYFYYLLRVFLKEELETRWADTRELPMSGNVTEIAARARELLEKARRQKLRSKSRR